MDQLFYSQKRVPVNNTANKTLRKEDAANSKKPPMGVIAIVVAVLMLSFVCYFVVGRFRKGNNRKLSATTSGGSGLRNEEITVPAGCSGGDTVEITLESGEVFEVQIPPGYKEGETFIVQLQAPDPAEQSDTDADTNSQRA